MLTPVESEQLTSLSTSASQSVSTNNNNTNGNSSNATEDVEEKKKRRRRIGAIALASSCLAVLALGAAVGGAAGGASSSSAKSVGYGASCDASNICSNNTDCVNALCTCSSGYFYDSTQCVKKGTYQESCTSSSQCDTSKLLSCANSTTKCDCPVISTPSKCDCPNGYYWDYAASTCYTQKTFGLACQNGKDYQCLSLGLTCLGNCSCNSTFYWNGTYCVPKLPLHSVCNTTYQCQDYLSPPLGCVANNCSCPTTHYPTATTCLLKKLYMVSCASVIECDNFKNLSCYTTSSNCNCPNTSTANICDCVATSYWDVAALSCQPRKQYGDTCNNGNTFECVTGKNLTCTGTCTCPTTHYWTGSTCALLKTYTQACFNSTECDASKSLSCSVISTNCNCPTTSTAGICDCAITTYWTGSTCAARKVYGTTCANTYECVAGLNMTCSTTCTCPSTHYWTGSTCALLKTYTQACFNSTECDASKGLSCPTSSTNCNCPTASAAGLCDCQLTQYWTGSTCANRKPYGTTCANTYECIANLNMTCSTTCRCPSTHYWTGTTCALLKTYTEACFNSTECDASKSLLCPATSTNCNCPTTSAANKCDCAITTYWNGNTCTARKVYGTPCANTYECTANINITCSTTCTCPTTHYWTGTTCALLKTYAASCFNSTECDASKSLSCPAASTSCNCPTLSAAGKCDCQITNYWNGLTCTARKPYGTTCANTYECIANLNMTCNSVCTCPTTHYWTGTTCALLRTYTQACFNSTECDASKGLSCPTSSTNCNCPTASAAGICDCQITQYWTGSTCANRKPYGTTCANTYECIANLNMTCSTTCRCPSTHYWTGTTCALFKTYTEACFNSTECDASKSLLCPATSTNCNCPTTSAANKCDCAITTYWNGNTCTARKVYGTPCANTYECTANINITCSTTCTCPTSHYWTGSACAPLKQYTVSCFNSTECDYRINLQCITGTCTCSSVNYWNGTAGACVPKKLYNVPCGSSIECHDGYNLLCTGGVCQCNSTNYYNGSYCVPLKEYKVACTASSQCWFYGNLSCINGVCDCPLPISQRMYWVPAYKNCQILPKNCKEILAKNTASPSGIYYLASSVGLLEAYCEMVIDGGGYTFVPWSSLSASTTMLQDIYLDTSKILFRFISRSNTNSQPYILTKQLSQYASVPISVQQNQHVGYNSPTNAGNYIYIGYLPQYMIQVGTTQGYDGNGKQFWFTNCDGNPNAYMALYANLYPTATNLYSSPGNVIGNWKASALTHPSGTYMPTTYFYFLEIHQGGCGGYEQSNQWADYFGAAVGFI